MLGMCVFVCVLFSFLLLFFFSVCNAAPFVYSIEGSRAVSEEYRVELRTTMGALLPPPPPKPNIICDIKTSQ